MMEKSENKFIVLDVETKNDFYEVGGRGNFDKLGISVAGAYHYAEKEYICYEEGELKLLESAIAFSDGIIGFNVKHFDFTVLQPYFAQVKLSDVFTIDL